MTPAPAIVVLLTCLADPSLRDADGRAHTPPAAPAAKAIVFLFLLPDCPVANYYAPEIKRLCADYKDRKVAAFVVHCDPDVTAARAREHAKEYGLPCSVLLDPTHALAKKLGATKAPEAVVVGPGGKV